MITLLMMVARETGSLSGSFQPMPAYYFFVIAIQETLGWVFGINIKIEDIEFKTEATTFCFILRCIEFLKLLQPIYVCIFKAKMNTLAIDFKVNCIIRREIASISNLENRLVFKAVVKHRSNKR